jgi:hypothetical protein
MASKGSRVVETAGMRAGDSREAQWCHHAHRQYSARQCWRVYAARGAEDSREVQWLRHALEPVNPKS